MTDPTPPAADLPALLADLERLAKLGDDGATFAEDIPNWREIAARAADEIERLREDNQKYKRRRARDAMSVAAHQAHAEASEARAARAEEQLKRWRRFIEQYEQLAEQAAEGQRATDVNVELRRQVEALDRVRIQVTEERDRLKADRDALARIREVMTDSTMGSESTCSAISHILRESGQPQPEAPSDPTKTPEEWCRQLGYTVLDPDGWRRPGAPAWADPITRGDFLRRVAVSTVQRRKTRSGAAGDVNAEEDQR